MDARRSSIVAVLQQVLLGLRRIFNPSPACSAASQLINLQVDDVENVLFSQGVEHDGFVNAVRSSGVATSFRSSSTLPLLTSCSSSRSFCLSLRWHWKPKLASFCNLAAPMLLVMMTIVFVKSILRPLASVSVPSFQNLQQHVEGVGMRLLNFVEEHQAVRIGDGLCRSADRRHHSRRNQPGTDEP